MSKKQEAPVSNAETTTETMQARFWKLEADREEILTKTAPLHAEYEKLNQEAAAILAKQKELAVKFKAIEEPIYEMEMERSRLAKALGGKTGERPG